MLAQAERSEAVKKVLLQILILNIVVCLAKIIAGAVFGILNLLADGVHSAGDSLSNVVGLVAMKFAGRKEDAKYPYGYEKFETLGAVVIAAIILLGLAQIVIRAAEKIFSSQPVEVNNLVLGVVIVTLASNIFISWYEKRRGLVLQSELLITDAAHTKSDVYVSGAVLAGLMLMKFGVIPATGRGDALVTLAVIFFIGRMVREIIKDPIAILCDAQVLDPAEVREIVMRVPGVRFCHAIRSHGRKTSCFLDMDIGVDPDLTVENAHDVICHAVKLALKEAFPNIKHARIHIEPDSDAGRARAGGVFRDRDSYGYQPPS